MIPRIPITDSRFVYTPSHATSLRDRFAAERAKIKLQQLREQEDTQRVIAIFDVRRANDTGTH